MAIVRLNSIEAKTHRNVSVICKKVNMSHKDLLVEMAESILIRDIKMPQVIFIMEMYEKSERILNSIK